MKTVKLNLKALHQAVAKKHEAINVGDRYFLSHFLDKEGAEVRVIRKSTKLNRAGFRSTVEVIVLKSDCSYYVPGATHTVNAANLYTHRRFASPAFKLGKEK